MLYITPCQSPSGSDLVLSVFQDLLEHIFCCVDQLEKCCTCNVCTVGGKFMV